MKNVGGGGWPGSEPPSRSLVGAVLAVAALLAAPFAVVERGLEAQHPHWLGFRGDMGAEVPFGSAGELFQGNVRGEFSLLIQPSAFEPVYVGFGFGWTTFHLEPPYHLAPADEEGRIEENDPWNHVGANLFVGLHFQRWISFPVYVEARLIERRLRPMDERFWVPNSDDYIDEKPFPQEHGFGVEGAVGFQLPLVRPSTFVDLTARASTFAPGDVVFVRMLDVYDDVEDQTVRSFEALPDITGGWTLGVQVGLVWFP